MAPDAAPTQQSLVTAASRLFAHHGIDAVTLTDIRRAAKQRNNSAIAYHFGSKDRLLQAVLDKHQPAIDQRRDALLEPLDTGGAPTAQIIAEALVLPLAEKLEDANGGAEFLQIQAQLLSRGDRRTTRAARPAAKRLSQLLQQADVADYPNTINLLLTLVLHGLADQSRRARSGDANFVHALTRSVTAVIETARSPTTCT